jgi:LacI family transcriptional regulator
MLKTRYTEISADLEARILKGEFSNRLPGVIKLVNEYSTGQATIKKAIKLLENKGLVTINGTKGTYISRKKAIKRKWVIGIVGLDIQPKIKIAAQKAIEEVIEPANYTPLYIPMSRKLIDESPEIIMQLPVDGFIFSNSVLNRNLVTLLRQRGLSLVSMNRVFELPGVNWVDYDNEGVVVDTLNYLVGLGHKRIGLIEFYNPYYNYSIIQKELFHKTLSNLGASGIFVANKGHIEAYDEYGENYYTDYIYDCVKECFKSKIPPTALILRLSHTQGLERAVSELGLRIPQDLSVVLESENGPLENYSYMNKPSAYRARKAAELLLDLIEEPNKPAKHILVPRELVKRKSCIPISTCMEKNFDEVMV